VKECMSVTGKESQSGRETQDHLQKTKVGHPAQNGPPRKAGPTKARETEDGGAKPLLRARKAKNGVDRGTPIRRLAFQERLRAEERRMGDQERVVGVRVERRLIAVEKSGIVNGAVMMDLAPVMVEKTEDARGTEGEFEDGRGTLKAAALAADDIEDFSTEVKGIVVELNGEASLASEEPFVDAADFRPAALDAAEGVVHGDVVGRGPVLAHEDKVAGVEGAIELRECVARMG